MNMNGYWVVWCNSGGELDRRFAKSEEEATKVCVEMVTEAGLSAGDTIRIEEGWSETD